MRFWVLSFIMHSAQLSHDTSSSFTRTSDSTTTSISLAAPHFVAARRVRSLPARIAVSHESLPSTGTSCSQCRRRRSHVHLQSKSSPLPPSISETNVTGRDEQPHNVDFDSLWRELLELLWDVIKLKTRRGLLQLRHMSRARFLRTSQSFKSVMLRAFASLSHERAQQAAADVQSSSTHCGLVDLRDSTAGSCARCCHTEPASDRILSDVHLCRNRSCAAKSTSCSTTLTTACMTTYVSTTQQQQQQLLLSRKSSLTKPILRDCRAVRDDCAAPTAFDVTLRPKKSLSFAAQPNIITHFDADAVGDDRCTESVYLTPKSSMRTSRSHSSSSKLQDAVDAVDVDNNYDPAQRDVDHIDVLTKYPLKHTIALRHRVHAPATPPLITVRESSVSIRQKTTVTASDADSSIAPMPPPRRKTALSQRESKPWIKTLPRHNIANVDLLLASPLRDVALASDNRELVSTLCDGEVQVAVVKLRPTNSNNSISSYSHARAAKSSLRAREMLTNRNSEHVESASHHQSRCVPVSTSPAAEVPVLVESSKNIYDSTLNNAAVGTTQRETSPKAAVRKNLPASRKNNNNNNNNNNNKESPQQSQLKNSTPSYSATVRVPSIGEHGGGELNVDRTSLISAASARTPGTAVAGVVSAIECSKSVSSCGKTLASNGLASRESFINRAESLLGKIDALLKAENDAGDIVCNGVDGSSTMHTTAAVMGADRTRAQLLALSNDRDLKKPLESFEAVEQQLVNEQIRKHPSSTAGARSRHAVASSFEWKSRTRTIAGADQVRHPGSVKHDGGGAATSGGNGAPLQVNGKLNFRHHMEYLKVAM